MTEAYYAGFWRRAVAYGIDKLILQVFCIILFTVGMSLQGGDYLVLSSTGQQQSDSMLIGGGFWSYFIMSVILDMVYFTWFHGADGRTPGKMMLGLRVVRTTGESMTFGFAFLRWVGYQISKLVFYLGFIWIAFDKRKKGWHDKIADSIVVRDAIWTKKCLDNESYII